MQKKRKAEEEAAAVAAQNSASITELTEEEASNLQAELDGKKIKWVWIAGSSLFMV